MSNADYGQGEKTLTEAADLVQGAKVDFDRLAKNLEGQIQGLQGRWVGQGGQAFFKLHKAWDEKQRIIVNALDRFEDALRKTEKDSKVTDDTNSQDLTRLTGRLG